MNIGRRFWTKVAIGDQRQCWEWKACRFRLGYGSFVIAGRNQSAHRVAWELTHGPIPPGIHVLHTCDNPGCVNPGHLKLGTHRDNMRDRQVRGRHSRASRNVGERHPMSRLKATQVQEIRRQYELGTKQHELAHRYGVGRPYISMIVNRRVWRHLE